jgi:hypothetical protein
MSERPRGKVVGVKVARILFVLVAAAVLAGCDRCGDFWRPIKFQAEACRDETPRPK